MGLFSKKKKNSNGENIEEVREQLARSQTEKQFYFNAVRSLLVFIRQFPLQLKEIDTPGFVQKIDAVIQDMVEGVGLGKQSSLFEKSKKQISAFIDRYKQCLEDREKEFKEIIRLLTKAMADFGMDNQTYNEKIFEKTDRIEQLTQLDDIKVIKASIKEEVSDIKTAISQKQENDNQQIATLSKRVAVLEEELKKAENESLRDGLTGVYNRLAFDRKMKQMMDSIAAGNSQYALLMIDIDDFKPINDTYGHQVGDRVIIAVVKKVTSFIRADDFAARYGGEEFAVILSGTNLRSAVKKAKQICKSLAATRYAISPTNNQQLSVTVSIGVAVSNKDDAEATLVERSDKALYKAKNTGKNRVVSEKEL